MSSSVGGSRAIVIGAGTAGLGLQPRSPITLSGDGSGARLARSYKNLIASIRPTGARNDAAEVYAFEVGVFERKNIVVDGPKRTIWTMLHSLIEGLDDIRLEVIAAWMGVHDSPPLRFRELVVRKAQHIHLDARSN
jgi:hypothetical protein